MSLTVPTYIRSEDTEKYLKIKESQRGAWTEFIHNALNPAKEPNERLRYAPAEKIPIEIPKPKVLDQAKTPAAAQQDYADERTAKPVTYKKTGNWGA